MHICVCIYYYYVYMFFHILSQVRFDFSLKNATVSQHNFARPGNLSPEACLCRMPWPRYCYRFRPTEATSGKKSQVLEVALTPRGVPPPGGDGDWLDWLWDHFWGGWTFWCSPRFTKMLLFCSHSNGLSLRASASLWRRFCSSHPAPGDAGPTSTDWDLQGAVLPCSADIHPFLQDLCHWV